MKRKDYNKNIVERCTTLLKSRDSSEIFEGVVLAAYLLEQVFKTELKILNPLLYFDDKSISDVMQIKIAMKKLSQEEELKRLKTNNAKQCIVQICEYRNELNSYKANFEELFEIRNSILHSIDDFSVNENSAAETAVSALRACSKYIAQYSGISAREFNPLTSKEFEKLQEKKHDERIANLKITMGEYKEIFEKLSPIEISKKINAKTKTDSCTWVEETAECPACEQYSFDRIGEVDFECNPDGVMTTGGYHFACRVCGLTLSEYEYELVRLEPAD